MIIEIALPDEADPYAIRDAVEDALGRPPGFAIRVVDGEDIPDKVARRIAQAVDGGSPVAASEWCAVWEKIAVRGGQYDSEALNRIATAMEREGARQDRFERQAEEARAKYERDMAEIRRQAEEAEEAE